MWLNSPYDLSLKTQIHFKYASFIIKMPSDRKTTLDTVLQTILKEIGGEYCVKVATELYKVNQERKEITDDELAEICEIKLNIVRKILYILYDHKLSDFRKVRDKKSGWFIYFWRECFDNVRDLIRNKQEQVLEKLTYRYQYESDNVFFICDNQIPLKVKKDFYKLSESNGPPEKKSKKPPKVESEESEEKIVKCCFVTTFNEAMDSEFQCRVCGAYMNEYNNTKVKEFLKEKIAILRQNIKNSCS